MIFKNYKKQDRGFSDPKACNGFVIDFFLNGPIVYGYNASVLGFAEKFISRLGGLINVMIRALLALVG